MRCNIRSLLPCITLCAALATSAPAHADALDAPASCVTHSRTVDGSADCREASVQKSRQNYPLAGWLDEQSESGLGLAFAAFMIGALALRVGLR